MNKLISFAVVVLACLAQCHGQSLTPVVQTNSGPVQGTLNTTVWHSVEYSSFRSIPYAKAPLGELRYKPPVQPDPWVEVLNATKDSSTCPQIDSYSNTYMGHEDCLYLNVYTPKTNFSETDNLLPVMVWIFGGSFSWGYANSTFYGPDFLMEDDVILVTFNYRMGALGYLYLDHPDAMGNAAMKDQAAVLQWVQTNIKAFGGNPENVTLFGESSGASSVILHLLSPLSSGLFNGCVIQSGTPFVSLFQTPSDALASAKVLAAQLNSTATTSDELLQFYLQANVEDLVNGQNTMYILPSLATMPFKPTIENSSLASSTNPVFLDECPITLLESGNYTKHNIMMGYLYNELISFTSVVYQALNFTSSILSAIDPTQTTDLQQLYGGIENVSSVLSDVTMVAGMDFAQRLLSVTDDDHPIYYYVISFWSDDLMHKLYGIPSLEAGHFDDVGMLFNVQALDAPTDPSDPLNVFRALVVKLWTNFATYGNPTPDNDNPISPTVWVPSGTEGVQLNISTASQMLPRPSHEDMVLVEELLFEVLPFTTGCKTVSTAVNFTTIF